MCLRELRESIYHHQNDVKYCCEACQRKAHSKMRYRQKRAEEQGAETV